MENQSMKHLELPEHEDLPVNDSLKFMLKEQNWLNQRIYPVVLKNLRLQSLPQPENFTTLVKEEMSKEYLVAIMRECAEALDMINSKAWKKTRNYIDSREFKFELIDIQHFLLSLYDIWGMNRDEVMRYYMAKNKENHARVERNY